MLGIDASEYQDPLPWASLKAQGLSFAILRASIGYLMDLKRLVHSRAADLAGVPHGWYHALWDHNLGDTSDTHPPTTFDPRRQARVFCQLTPWDQTLLSVGGVFLPRYWVDVEAFGITAASLAAFLDEWDLLRPETVIGIYTSRYFWQVWGGHGLIGAGHPEFALRPLWVADYRAGAPALPDIWPRALIHQWRYKAGYFASYLKDLDINVLLPQPEAPVLTPNHIKLGPHHMQGGNTTGDWLQLVPTVAKFVGDLGASVQALPGTLNFGRVVDDGLLDGQGFDVNRYIKQGADPVERAAAYIRLLRPYIDSNPHIAAWEGPNEQILESDDQAEAADPAVHARYDANRQKFMEWYGDFCYAFAAGLHALGKRAGIGSWASGQPRPEHNLWRFWTRALQATVDFGAIECRHDYAGIDVTGLLRCVYDNSEFERLGFVGVPQVITELGADVGGTGWRQLFHDDVGACYRQLIRPWLDQVAHLPWLLGACWFTDGGRGWENYDVANTLIVSCLAGYPAPPLEETMPISAATKKSMHDAAAVILAGAQGLLAQVDAIVVDDVPPTIKHTMATLTNQQVINLFAKVLALAYLENALTAAQKATLYTKDATGLRSALYSGPAVEDMANLTGGQKAQIIAALPPAG